MVTTFTAGSPTASHTLIVSAIVLTLAALLATSSAPAADTGRHGAHQHGVATLQVSLDGGVLQITYEGPAENILGFEHAPRTDAQRKTVARAEEELRQSAQLFTTPPAAACRAQPARIEMTLPTAHSGETHSEIEAEWRWNCARPDALAHVDVGLFTTFPRLKQLRAQVVTGKGQTTALLKPGTARLTLGP
jgi:hypothetical protein